MRAGAYKKRKPEVKGQYTDIELAMIFTALKMKASEEIQRRLQNAARYYRLAVDIERDLPPRNYDRKALKKLHQHAVAVVTHATAIEALPISPKLVLGKVKVAALDLAMRKRIAALNLAELVEDFEDLAKAAKKEADSIGERGRTPESARYTLVSDLETIFRMATGKKATGTHSGHFHQFVEKAVTLLNPHAIAGITGEIQKVLLMSKRPSD